MKKKILDFCINSIKKNSDVEYNDEKIAEIRYGLEAIYLTITKVIVIWTVALILGLFKEMLILLIFYGLLRSTAYGIHASKSSICLISSLIVFIGAPYLATKLIIPLYIKIIICGLCVTLFALYAPADTKKHPLIHKNKRIAYRIATVITSLIFTFICLYTKNEFISNSLLFALLIETALILPISYKIFNLPYNNYKNYLCQNQ